MVSVTPAARKQLWHIWSLRTLWWQGLRFFLCPYLFSKICPTEHYADWNLEKRWRAPVKPRGSTYFGSDLPNYAGFLAKYQCKNSPRKLHAWLNYWVL